MALHESLNEKMYTIQEHLHSGVKKAQDTFNDISIAHPYFMDIDALSTSIEDFPNVRTSIDETDQWGECQMVRYHNGFMALKDLFDTTVRFILYDRKNYFIITADDKIYSSSDGIHFGESFLPDPKISAEYGPSLMEGRTAHFHIDREYSTGKVSADVNISIADGKPRIVIDWPLSDRIISNLSELNNLVAIFEYKAENDKKLLLIGKNSYHTFDVAQYIDHQYYTINPSEGVVDNSNGLSLEFIFDSPIISAKRMSDSSFIILDNSFNSLVMSDPLPNGNFLINNLRSITHVDNHFLIGARHTYFFKEISNETLVTIYPMHGSEPIADSYTVYPGWNKKYTLCDIRALFTRKNYMCLIDNDNVWICPVLPMIDHDSREVYFCGIRLGIPEFIREYDAIWKCGDFIYIKSTVKSLYCMRLPNTIPEALFASRNSEYINGFYSHAQKGALSNSLEGIGWSFPTSVAFVTQSIKELGRREVQTASAGGIGMLLAIDREDDLYFLFENSISNRHFSYVDNIEIDPAPYPGNQDFFTGIRPSTHKFIIAAANGKIYGLLYDLKTRILTLLTFSGSAKKCHSVRIIADNNLQTYMEGAIYAVGFMGSMHIVRDPYANSSMVEMFAFSPERYISASVPAIYATETGNNNENTIPNVYVYDNQLVYNSMYETRWYCMNYRDPEYSDDYLVTKITRSIEVNDLATRYMYHSIGRTGIMFSTKEHPSSDGNGYILYSDDKNEWKIHCHSATPGGTLYHCIDLTKEYDEYQEVDVCYGRLYRISNAVMFVDSVNQFSIITYDGIIWDKIEAGSFPKNISYMTFMESLNLCFHENVISINGNLRPRDRSIHVFKDENIFAPGVTEYHHSFSTSPNHIIIDIKLEMNDKSKISMSLVFSDGEFIGGVELKKCLHVEDSKEGTIIEWNDGVNEFCLMTYNGRQVDICIKDTLLQERTITASSILINAIA